MRKIFKKSISAVLTLCMIFSLVQGLCIIANAESSSVEIVSFVRKTDKGLRSSELLEAKVTGYDGNISDLTFTWDNQLGTYLYVYNSSNMYNIKDTAGEVSINGALYILGFQIVKGDAYSGKGYAWASVYGANLLDSSLNGTVTVTVTDKDGKVIGTDSYTDFQKPSLQSDLAAAKYGVFEGEEINLKDMLGRSSIVHIDCEACNVGEASTVNGDIISIKKEDNDYMVTGVKSGVAEVSLSLSKSNCKFHRNSGNCEINNVVYVFKKPGTSTTTTTLTLTNIDSNCDYFIGNVQGVETSDDTVVFTNLTPDTTYEVTVRGNYSEGYAYAYVTDTTKPVYRATVNFYTDNALADTLEYYKVSGNLFLKEQDSDEYIALTKSVTGKYTADVSNGVYHIYYKNGSYTRFGDYQLTINNQNNELNIHTYSVRYDANEGVFGGNGGVYQSGGAAYVTEVVPTRSGYNFLYWTDADNKQYKPGQLITSNISKPYVLVAQWEKAVEVKVNVTINHGQNHAIDMDEVSFRLVKNVNGVSYPTANACTLTSYSHAGFDYKAENAVSTYSATAKTFDGEKGATYSVSCAKSGYSVDSVTATPDADGNIVVDVVLVFNPNNFDLTFDVAMDENIPSYLYPAGVNVQVTYWGLDSANVLGWHIIEQHNDGTAVPVRINEDGKGKGSYPVWQLWADQTHPYFYRIDVVSYILADGTIVTKDANAFTSTVDVVGGGGIPNHPSESSTNVVGALYENGAQNGIPTATISIESNNLTFDANGGKIEGENTLTVEKQVVISDTLKYVPVRDGGYTFDGWYMDKECTVKAVDGTRIKADTTLFAGWKDPLSVSGEITVDAFYYSNNDKVEVLEVDRATELVTILQVKHNGTYNDYASVNSKLEYINDVAKVEYNFDKIANLGDDYRIKTELINYETTYNNNNDSNFTSDEYVVLFDQEGTANVNAKLTFKADEFDQKYKIDATAIGEEYRFETGLTRILFQTTGSNPPDTEISQHQVAPYGEVLNFEGGVASGSVKLWKGISNGAMSSYQLKLISFDGTDYTYESPYSVRYGATTSWSTANSEAGVLTATIVPKEYAVNFDLNADGDTVGNMETFASETGYFTTHKWSYDTLIEAQPTREGYVFLGWEEVEKGTFNEETQTVNGSVAKDITIKAKWSQFKWETDTDSGYYMTGTGKTSVIRFLFDFDTTAEFEQGIEQTGIKFIKSVDIAGKVENSTFAGKALTGSETTFYGDIVDITEDKANVKYYAVAYALCNGVTFWSLPVECGPNFSDLIEYK